MKNSQYSDSFEIIRIRIFVYEMIRLIDGSFREDGSNNQLVEWVKVYCIDGCSEEYLMKGANGSLLREIERMGYYEYLYCMRLHEGYF